MDLAALTTIAEVGAAIAGFATLAGIVQRDRLQIESAFGVVQCALLATGFAILPLVLGHEPATLRILAVLLFFLWALAWGFAMVRMRGLILREGFGREARRTGTVFEPVFVFLNNAAGLCASAAVALSLAPEHRDLLYRVAVAVPLITAMVLLWSTVRRMLLADPADD